jgi:hypothetical protein
MATTKSIEDLNRELGEQVLADAKSNPQNYVGRYVGIANGEVIVSTNSLSELVGRLKEEPDAAQTFFVDIARDPNKVLRISETWYALFPLVPHERPSCDSNNAYGYQGSKNDTDASS